MRKAIAYSKQLQLRLTVLIPVLAALVCFFAARAHISSVGKTFDYALDEFAGQAVTAEQISVSPPDLVKIRSTYLRDDGIPVVTFEALNDGEGLGIVALPGAGMQFSLSVKEGIVIADNVNFTGWEAIHLSLVVVAALSSIVFIRGFLQMLRDAWFDYGMAGYAGAGLFSLLQTIVFVQILASGSARSFADLATSITTIADRFVELMLAPISICAVLVAASNLALVRREGRGLTNMLGVFFSLAFAFACVTWKAIAAMASAQLELIDQLIWICAGSLSALAISFAITLLVGVSITAWLAAHHVPTKPRDYIMILGCGLRADGSPTPLLAGRVDAARQFAAQQIAEGLPAPTLVPSGGQGADEVWSEAEAMHRYLQESDASLRVVLEDKSTNTKQNMAFSREVIEADLATRQDDGAPSDASFDELRLAFSTTNYHVMRGYVYAHEAGYVAEGIAAKTKLYFWPNAFLREFVGLIVARAPHILAMLACAELVYGVALYATLMGGN